MELWQPANPNIITYNKISYNVDLLAMIKVISSLLKVVLLESGTSSLLK